MIVLLSGPDLPTAALGLSMVESANGILAIGGRDENGNYLKSILRLSCNNGNECQWIKEGELNHARSYFSVIPYTDLARIPLLQPILDAISVVIPWGRFRFT